ncbi:MAG: type II toxin-antitoxin system VapC family toxin [Mucilaginibacter sp.]|uniref:type II toxin-antitoxin system VapC family toxin n=1 Tax=Mucilaginibacter sp. TaxID=1882438 RepID=UPI0034E4D42D
MRFLIDTHVLIWFINGDELLPERAISDVKNINNECFISIASIWEIAIKVSLNKLELKSEFDKIIDFLTDLDIEILPITFEHIQILNTLEYHHKDPFDRMIISQAISEQLTIITKDENFIKYQVMVKW